ncbi:MAG: C40 family peptidase [Planctomycetes bacterium]|nr:C40 family peptidase [Planctomycetota bacterium]
MCPAVLAASIVCIHLAAAPVASPTPPAAVQRAIDEFTPLWKPTEPALEGITVGIETASGPADDGGMGAEIELVTASYLYHYVLAAGGTPVITRPDLSATAGQVGRSAGDRARLLREEGCDVCVAISYTPAGAKTTPGDSGDAWSNGTNDARRSLADHLQAGLEKRISSIEIARGLRATLVELTLPRSLTRQDGQFWRLAQTNARALYEGISRYWSEQRQPATPADGLTPEAAKPTTISPVPDTRTSTVDERMRRLGRSIWPVGRLPDEKLEWFCRGFSRSVARTSSMVYFVPEVRIEDGSVVVSGATNAPRTVEGLRQALAGVGIVRLRNEMRTLPDGDRLGQELYGACRVPMVLTFDRPTERGALQTQLLFGEPVFLLDRQEGFFLLLAGDGYWGWVRADAVQPMNATEFDRYAGHPRGVLLRDVVIDGMTLPRGAAVPIVPRESGGHLILLPDGSRHAAPDGVIAESERASEAAATRVAAALDLLGAPYVFGGRSPLGLDCSGLIANVWARCGQASARDAWQQALAGTLTATWWYRQGMRPGDQVFFIDPAGKLYHTGVAISPTHVLHSAPPGVQIGSIKSGDRLYDPRLDRDFFMAKRP